jgi:excisionase family DNA binding protein
VLDLLSPTAKAALVRLIDERVAEHLANSSSTPTSPWLTIDEAAEYLRTTPGAIRKRISRRQIGAYRPEGSRILLRREDLDALDRCA